MSKTDFLENTSLVDCLAGARNCKLAQSTQLMTLTFLCSQSEYSQTESAYSLK